MSDNNDNQPEDRDLQVNGKMEFVINFIEQPNSSISYSVKALADRENTVVQYAMTASNLREILAENQKQTDKHKKMKATHVREYAAAATLCERLAAILADRVYTEGMKRPDVRTVTFNQPEETVN